jgi:very-short-patch-repair endonuclease
MRKDMTTAERVLWERLRGGQVLGFRFRRQQVITGFIVDFYCHAARLVIEVDGAGHIKQMEYDTERDAALVALGLRIERFQNDAVLTHLPDVLASITECLQAASDLTP